MKTKILISGGTGFVGIELTKYLISKGYEVAILSRKKHIEGVKSFYWNWESGFIDSEAIEFADIIIHLAGENIAAKRWSAKQKQKIIDSRVKTANLLFEATKRAQKKPKQFISASAVGFYGNEQSEKIFSEDDIAGNGFLAETVKQWEKSADQFQSLGIKVVKLRTGLVLSKTGGALSKMLIPIKLGIGSSLGSGKQYVPWIELSDLVKMYLFVIENELSATIYNAVSPDITSNYDFMQRLAKSLKRPFFMPAVPAFLLKLIFGELAEIFLSGSKISSERIQKEGFDFQYKNIESVL